MEQEKVMILKTVRLDADSIKQIATIVDKTGGGATQSTVIRHLIHSALGKTSSLKMKQENDLPAETKLMLFELSNEITELRTELNRIGSNINVHRRKYNIERNKLLSQIESQKKLLSTMILTHA